MTDDLPFDAGTDASLPVERLDRGLNLLFAAEVASDVFDAVDVEAFRSADRIEDAVDVGTLAVAVGQPAGRLVARGAAKGVLGGGVAGLVGREIAGRAGARAWERACTATDLSPSDRAGESATRVPFVDEDDDADGTAGDASDD